MMYGRRMIENKHRRNRRTRHFAIHDKGFQYKYTSFLLIGIAGAILLFAGPSYYFLNQNYQIFLKLAYDTNPGLIEHLEREIIWLNTFLAIAATSTLIFCTLIGLKMTGNLIAPLIKMERHIKKLTEGDWTTPDFRTREMDEFKDLSISYAYFYRALKAYSEAELKMLEKLNIDPQNREAYSNWRMLVLNKQKQLGKPTNDEPIIGISGSESGVRDSRLVS